ncbi:uncharacterized protein N7459_008646 [Penicillium hispanicum]|uniref:F-box domain-containing protein n=1 Tax=Penicillium cinerascens TaxID=70096 RepID=A0A9W9JPX5_9EURO|nr:uncharacterized protein N7459_008646 [Penicillium hispanicum]XP_058307223.1 uncharacterized protein N7498_007912 [Penicillium cinerascens]KAJ5198795.1 hypothetical protein N7498_007912 [Penicillium cinerascens]KAJ5574219.1 hypothetical protein N7459_008646 [Penicillium hispanicum]
MPSGQGIHLPDEIVEFIVGWLYELPRHRTPDSQDHRSPDLKRQIDLWAFCAVSRQWYRVGLRHLYRCPALWENNSFALFMRTVKGASPDLGSKVMILNLQKLQHQSSPSQTARLISWTKKGLRSFFAPRVSFATNCLAPLSKCNNITMLDLSLVGGRSFSFSRLKKAICSLPKISTLRLPISVPITDPNDSTGQWPSSLWNMHIGGLLIPTVMLSFQWPPNISCLTVSGCLDLNPEVLESLLGNTQLRDSLKSLTLRPDNRYIFDDSSAILYEMAALYHLEIPVDLMYPLCILPSSFDSLPIRHLVLSKPYDEEFWKSASNPDDNSFKNRIAEDIYEALDEGESLSNIWTLGVDPKYKPWACEHQQDGIEAAIIHHLDDFLDEELDEMLFEEMGIYWASG